MLRSYKYSSRWFVPLLSTLRFLLHVWANARWPSYKQYRTQPSEQHLKYVSTKRQKKSNKSIHEAANISLVSDRLNFLAQRYISSALINNNPIIPDCASEFIEMANFNGLLIPSLFNAVLSPASESILDPSTFRD